MKFLLEIECDNDAFAPDQRAEVARLLRDAADRIAATRMDMSTLRDGNGNRVGIFYFEQAE